MIDAERTVLDPRTAYRRHPDRTSGDAETGGKKRLNGSRRMDKRVVSNTPSGEAFTANHRRSPILRS
jgi:hypothetical protein